MLLTAFPSDFHLYRIVDAIFEEIRSKKLSASSGTLRPVIELYISEILAPLFVVGGSKGTL